MVIGNHTLPTEIFTTCTDGFVWCFANWAYVVTSGMFWTFMLIAFSIVLMIATIRMGTARAFGYGSFVGMIGAIWFAIMKLMPWSIASAFILVGAIGIIMMIISEK